jgi:peptide/nickel transport system permease protein
MASVSISESHQTTMARKNTSRSIWRIAFRRFTKNRVAVVSAIFLMVMIIVAAIAPLLTPYNPNAVNILMPHAEPSGDHWLGTDESGRDVFSRLLVGAQASIAVGLISMVISISIGVLIGSISGFVGGWVDSILMRVTDGMMAIPYFFLVLIVVAVFGTSFQNIVMVIGATSWMVVARVVRSDVLRYRNFEFVVAARSLGASNLRVLFRHVVPHTSPSIIVAATLGVANAILLESALSYLGLGIQQPQASWGNMLSKSQAYLFDNPILPLYPGLMILFVVLAFNFLGDALRDALDPQFKEGGH